MAAKLQQKTKGLGGVIVGHPDTGNLRCVSIGFPSKRANRLTTKRWRAKSKALWLREELGAA